MTSRRGVSTEHQEICALLVQLSARAEALVMEVYHAPFSVEFKGPADPVTLADKRANELIVTELMRAFPGVPVVAEESPKEDYASYVDAERAFFVDPVDGTNEFVKKSGEFCVMLGYVERGAPVVGVIGDPVRGLRYEGILGEDCHARVVAADGSSRDLAVSGVDFEQGLAVISRSHHSATTDAALDRLRVPGRENYGSAGLKAMRVADGSAFCYLHAGYAGSRWDAAAPEAIARAAGASYTDLHGMLYRYDESDLGNSRGVLALPMHLAEEAQRRLGRHP